MTRLRFSVLAACLAAGTFVLAAGALTHAVSPPDFTGPEPGEELPGGEATSRKSVDNANAFSNSSGNLPFEKELDFKVGNGIFRKLWVSAPSSTTSSDGLGPIFNSRSCQRCHLKDGRGHPPEANFPDDDATSMFLRLSIPPQTQEHKRQLAERRINVVPEPTYGTQLQDFSIQGIDAEGKMHIEYEEQVFTFPDGQQVKLRKPAYTVKNLAYGPLHPKTMISPRVANQMIGLGLLEAVPEKDIRALADPEDSDGDGISGRANEVWSTEQDRAMLGRFGWKAGAPSVKQQSAEAFAGDIGISNPLAKRPSGDCTEKQPRCLAALNGNSKKEGVEASSTFLDLVSFYSRNLAVPKRRNASAPEVLAGKRLFHETGCGTCHHPSFTTGDAPGQPHLSGQKIWPYTDMLLHDMGDGLADNRPEGVADGREWRTAPLWGIGLTKIVNGHEFFLHDGRARGIVEAILWHGGEAANARDAFAKLTEKERNQLVAFVKSL